MHIPEPHKMAAAASPAAPHYELVVGDEAGSYEFSWRKCIRFFGPGLLMAIAYVVSAVTRG